MRASALSCLAAVAESDPLSLLPFLYQLMDYLRHVLIFETSIETRRAVIYHFYSIIHGLKENIFQNFPKALMNQLKTQLEFVAEKDSDNLTRKNAQQTIDYLNELFETFLQF